MKTSFDEIIEKKKLKLRKKERWIRVYQPLIILFAFITLLYAAVYTDKISEKLLDKSREPLAITKDALKSHPEIAADKNKLINICNSDIEYYVQMTTTKGMLSIVAPIFGVLAFLQLAMYFKHKEEWKKEKEELLLLEAIREAITNEKKT